jgi:hypothetical protein
MTTHVSIEAFEEANNALYLHLLEVGAIGPGSPSLAYAEMLRRILFCGKTPQDMTPSFTRPRGEFVPPDLPAIRQAFGNRT